jgi:hypothetical protein
MASRHYGAPVAPVIEMALRAGMQHSAQSVHARAVDSAAGHGGRRAADGAMAVQITISVPDDLGQRLQPYRERLPELLERGLRDAMAEQAGAAHDEQAIIAALVSQPTPEQVLALRPSPTLQQRVSDLLARSKAGQLLRDDERELDRLLLLDHLVRLAKARAALARG